MKIKRKVDDKGRVNLPKDILSEIDVVDKEVYLDIIYNNSKPIITIELADNNIDKKVLHS